MIVQELPDWWYGIECAVRADGTSPARTFLDELKEGIWEPDPDVERIPDDEQIRDYHRLVELMRHFAQHGDPPRSRQIQYLRDGIWEFKVARKRLAFYDTDGIGGFEPKPKIQHIDDSPSPHSPTWYIPTFDFHLRLANAWPKLGETAEEIDIDEAVQIREEDLAHDRQPDEPTVGD